MEKENRLTSLRAQKGMTQREVAEELGVTRQAVSQWESGKVYPSVEKLWELSRLYGVSMEELCAPWDPAGGRTAPPPPPAKKPRWDGRTISLLLAAGYLCFAAGVLIWGEVTNSRSMAKAGLLFTTILLLLLLLLIRFLKKLYINICNLRKENK